MTNRQIAAMETKKKLLEAAKNIICEKGLLNTSIEEITKACGVSNGTFYTYFKRKEDIVFALGDYMYQELYEQAMAYEAGITERLVFYMTRFAEYTEKSSLKLCQEWVRNAVDLTETFTDVLYGQMLCWDISGGTYSFGERTGKFCENFLRLIIAPY